MGLDPASRSAVTALSPSAPARTRIRRLDSMHRGDIIGANEPMARGLPAQFHNVSSHTSPSEATSIANWGPSSMSPRMYHPQLLARTLFTRSRLNLDQIPAVESTSADGPVNTSPTTKDKAAIPAASADVVSVTVRGQPVTISFQRRRCRSVLPRGHPVDRHPPLTRQLEMVTPTKTASFTSGAEPTLRTRSCPILNVRVLKSAETHDALPSESNFTAPSSVRVSAVPSQRSRSLVARTWL